MMTPMVIDIYHGNNIRDFAAVKAAGIVGVIHKATQGSGYVDPLYESRRKLATDVGLLWGAYCFNTGDAIENQVRTFLDHADPDDDTLIALDFEDNPHSQMSLTQARLFLQAIEEEFGRKAVLYSGNRIKDLLGQHVDSYFGSHRLWLAQYGPVAKVQASWGKQWLWQYSDSGKLPGTDGAIDLNAYDGSANDLALEWSS